MTREQLKAARAAHWRQKQNPILTLEDAESWVEQHPLCLFLPRQAQFPAPAPSFVEACLGSGQAAPGIAAIEQAQGLLARLITAGTVVPLNLLGAVGEQPDFLAHRQALPFVVALRGDSDWKHAPQKSSGHKVSPLVLELWKALDQDGGLTAIEAREKLGRELTEAAVLRGLCELWQGLRVSPVLGDAGEPAKWELLRVRHQDALATATSTGQVTALSLLVSMYLQSVYAATGEEIEIFLSPVASRSRVREAVRGLSATRQIHSLSMDAQTYYFLEGGLPEFGEPVVPVVVKVEAPRRALPVPGPRPVPRPRPVSPSRASNAPAARLARSASAPAKSRPPQPWVKKTEWKARPPAAGSGKGPERRTGTAPSGIRPEQKTENRPGAWRGDPKRARPAAWARPGSGLGQGPGAPRTAGKPGDRPFRGPQKPRPQTASGVAPAGAGRERFTGRPPRGARGPGDPSRAASYRSPARTGGRPGPVAGPKGEPGVNRPAGLGRPAGRPAGPFRPSSRPSAPRPSGERPNGPRLAGVSRPGASRPGGQGRGGPPKAWPRTGASTSRPGRKPGKPSAGFRGRKPDRKKPGV